MSFRVDRNRVVFLKRPADDNMIELRAGHFTVIWWRKGSEVDGFWFKADIYGPDKEMYCAEILASTYPELQRRCQEIVGSVP